MNEFVGGNLIDSTGSRLVPHPNALEQDHLVRRIASLECELHESTLLLTNKSVALECERDQALVEITRLTDRQGELERDLLECLAQRSELISAMKKMRLEHWDHMSQIKNLEAGLEMSMIQANARGAEVTHLQTAITAAQRQVQLLMQEAAAYRRELVALKSECAAGSDEKNTPIRMAILPTSNESGAKQGVSQIEKGIQTEGGSPLEDCAKELNVASKALPSHVACGNGRHPAESAPLDASSSPLPDSLGRDDQNLQIVEALSRLFEKQNQLLDSLGRSVDILEKQVESFSTALEDCLSVACTTKLEGSFPDTVTSNLASFDVTSDAETKLVNPKVATQGSSRALSDYNTTHMDTQAFISSIRSVKKEWIHQRLEAFCSDRHVPNDEKSFEAYKFTDHSSTGIDVIKSTASCSPICASLMYSHGNGEGSSSGIPPVEPFPVTLGMAYTAVTSLGRPITVHTHHIALESSPLYRRLRALGDFFQKMSPLMQHLHSERDSQLSRSSVRQVALIQSNKELHYQVDHLKTILKEKTSSIEELRRTNASLLEQLEQCQTTHCSAVQQQTSALAAMESAHRTELDRVVTQHASVLDGCRLEINSLERRLQRNQDDLQASHSECTRLRELIQRTQAKLKAQKVLRSDSEKERAQLRIALAGAQREVARLEAPRARWTEDGRSQRLSDFEEEVEQGSWHRIPQVWDNRKGLDTTGRDLVFIQTAEHDGRSVSGVPSSRTSQARCEAMIHQRIQTPHTSSSVGTKTPKPPRTMKKNQYNPPMLQFYDVNLRCETPPPPAPSCVPVQRLKRSAQDHTDGKPTSSESVALLRSRPPSPSWW